MKLITHILKLFDFSTEFEEAKMLREIVNQSITINYKSVIDPLLSFKRTKSLLDQLIPTAVSC